MSMIDASVKTTVRWWPVITRGSLWVMISVLTTFIDKTDGLTAAKMQTMTWLDWTRLIAMICLGGALTLRTFMDQTLSKHVELLADEAQAKKDVNTLPEPPKPEPPK